MFHLRIVRTSWGWWERAMKASNPGWLLLPPESDLREELPALGAAGKCWRSPAVLLFGSRAVPWCCSLGWPCWQHSAALPMRAGKTPVTASAAAWAEAQQQSPSSSALCIYLEYTARGTVASRCFSHCLLIVAVVTASQCLSARKTLCVTN